MRKCSLALLVSLMFMMAHAQPKHVVISQVFGAGGLTNAPLSHDFVEIFNPTNDSVVLDGWSIQYAPATNNRWATGTVKLAGTIAPGQYFLIQLNGKDGIGKPLPTPDIISTVNVDVSATSGKVALVNSITALDGNCPVSNTIVDFVGFGTADCSESTNAPATSNTRSIIRINNGCTDTDDNAADFITTAPSPRNGSAAANFCNSGTIAVTGILPLPFCIDNVTGASANISFQSTGTFTNARFNAVLSDATGSFTAPLLIGNTTVSGTNPTGTIAVQIPKGLPTAKAYRIRVDVVSPSITGQPSTSFEIINEAANVNAFTASPNADKVTLNWLNPAGCFTELLIVAKEGSAVTGTPAGDGSAYVADLNFQGNGTAFNGGKVVYKGTGSGPVVTGFETGKEYFFKAFTRNGTYWSSGFEIKVKTRLLPLPGEILINQISPQYDSASYEYIELVNTTGKTFDLSELTISYHAAKGTKGVAGNTLTGILQPHSYWLLSSKEVVTVGKTSLPRDGHLTDGFAATAGQLALLRKTDSTVIDGFGYGAIEVATYTEAQPAPAPTTKGGLKRKGEGIDTNNNSLDFERVNNADIDLRNSQSRLANAGAGIAAGTYSRLIVTGNASITGNVIITDKVVLQKGLLQLANHNLTAAKTEGGSAGSYVQTDGAGKLILKKVADANTVLPIGNKTYNPVTITQGGGVDWQAQVTDNILHQPVPFDKTKAVLRTWQVAPLSKPAAGATIVLQYNDNDPLQVGSNFSKSEVQVWNYDNNWSAAGMHQKPVEANGIKTATVTGWQQEGTFAISNVMAEMAALTILPIRFTDVKAVELPHAVQIEFTNSTESDVARYEVERSANGIDFITVATLKPLYNNGGAATYQWQDKTRPAGTNYYRIKGVETNGKTIYSIILKVDVDRSTKGLSVFPNPVKGSQLTWEASLPRGRYLLRVTGSNGQQVLFKHFDYSGGNISQVLQLPSGLRPGVYTLQLINGNFIRQHSFVVL